MDRVVLPFKRSFQDGSLRTNAGASVIISADFLKCSLQTKRSLLQSEMLLLFRILINRELGELSFEEGESLIGYLTVSIH